MEKGNLYIIVSIVLVVGLVLSFSGLTGKNIQTIGQLGKCTETDGGDNPGAPGTVGYTNVDTEYKDDCYAKSSSGIEKYLKERYCDRGRLQNNVYVCLNGCLENSKGEGYCKDGEFNEINTQT